MSQNVKFISLRQLCSSIPTFIIGLIPVLKSCPPCPLCIPKYAAVLTIFGLELADYRQYLVPIMLISITFTLWSMYNQTRLRKPIYTPLVIACVSCALLLFSKYFICNYTLTYIMMIVLLSSLIWHHTTLGLVNKCDKDKKCDCINNTY